MFDGDHSSWIGDKPPEWENIAAWLHADRIARSPGGESMKAILAARRHSGNEMR